MANDSVRTVWSKEMEARFQELQRQRDAALAQNTKPISDFFEEILRDFKNIDVDEMDNPGLIKTVVARSIHNAEHLRDILKPFDGRE